MVPKSKMAKMTKICQKWQKTKFGKNDQNGPKWQK